MKEAALAFRELPVGHSRKNKANVFFSVLEEFSITDKCYGSVYLLLLPPFPQCCHIGDIIVNGSPGGLTTANIINLVGKLWKKISRCFLFSGLSFHRGIASKLGGHSWVAWGRSLVSGVLSAAIFFFVLVFFSVTFDRWLSKSLACGKSRHKVIVIFTVRWREHPVHSRVAHRTAIFFLDSGFFFDTDCSWRHTEKAAIFLVRFADFRSNYPLREKIADFDFDFDR